MSAENQLPSTATPKKGVHDGTLTSRFECKYLISPGLAESIRHYMRPYVRPDRYAMSRPGFRYSISSLYLDSPELHLHQMTLDGAKSRFKLRIRTYGDGEDDPVFFEVKKRMDGAIYKHRAKLSRRAFAEYLQSFEGDLSSVEPKTKALLEEFSQLAIGHGAGPVMRVRYSREAYESVAGDPVRITFDTDLVSALTYDYDLQHAGTGWVPTPVEGTILELKFTDRYPPWVGELVERFELRRCSVAKYVLSMEKALADGRCRRPMFRRGRFGAISA